jgi:hypothetical protein
MSQGIKNRIQSTLPEFTLENLYADHTFDANGKIIGGYIKEDDSERDNKIQAMKDVEGLVTLKDIKLESLVPEIGSRMGLDEKSAKEVALIMLCDIFYPIKDFFPGIEDEILKLGGELPKGLVKGLDEQFLKREEEMEEMEAEKVEAERERMADTIVNDNINKLMANFPESGEMVIGSQKSIAVKDMPVEMKPMIKYWIEDYKQKMGYYNHSNLERVQYVCHDKNTRNMNEEERRELNLILKSADEEIELPYSTKRKKIDFSLIEEE